MVFMNDLIDKYKYGSKYYVLPDEYEHTDRFNHKVINYGNGRCIRVFANKWAFKFPSSSKKDTSVKFSRDNYKAGFFKEKDLSDSVMRSRNAIRDIIYLNDDLSLFVTFTFDLKKVNSLSPDDVVKKMKVWLSNMVSRKGLKYIIVPELMPDHGYIHFHGYINDVLTLTDSGTRYVAGFKKPVKISNFKKYRISDSQVNWEQVVYNISEYKLGFNTCIKAYGCKSARIGYILEYMSKDIDTNKIFGKRYWSSKGLERCADVHLCSIPPDVYSSVNAPVYDGKDGSRYKFVDNTLDKEF